ncbi:MAG TPA: YrdB family protein [Candidatus Limnocylindrales bacterium]|nr:YrdB family protein [Candidatus Limnocylindrales bacterium]
MAERRADPVEQRRPSELHLGPNEVLRFLLEIAALVAMGIWGWNAFEPPLNVLAAVGVPLAAAIIWGTFRVPDDPGRAAVPVPGPVRLAIELAFFAAAVVLLHAAGQENAALAMAGLIVLHYALGYQRVEWLLRGGGR